MNWSPWRKLLTLHDQDQDSYWWNAETTITHQELCTILSLKFSTDYKADFDA